MKGFFWDKFFEIEVSWEIFYSLAFSFYTLISTKHTYLFHKLKSHPSKSKHTKNSLILNITNSLINSFIQTLTYI